MKKTIAKLIIYSCFICSIFGVQANEDVSTYDVIKNLVPQDKCPIQIKNENADFYDCGTYTLTYTKNPYGLDKKYFKYCSKKSDGSLEECYYM